MEWQPLDFEKPIFELERRLQDLKSHSTKHDVDLGSAVKELEVKLRETRRHVYGNLTAWQRAKSPGTLKGRSRSITFNAVLRTGSNCTATAALPTIAQCHAEWQCSAASVASLSLTKRGAIPRRT